MDTEWIARSELMLRAKEAIERSSVVLDIGAGIRNAEWAEGELHILCEPFADYVQVLRDKFSDDPRMVIVYSDGNALLATLPDASVDTILLIDVIEHIEKNAGIELLRECERVARQQIVVFTPLGYMEQDYQPGDVDGWGYKGGQWQRHLSGWLPEDFDPSWRILACQEYHSLNGKGEPFDPPFGAFWAIKKVEPKKPASNGLLGALIHTHAHLLRDYAGLKQAHTQLGEQAAAQEARNTALEAQLSAVEEGQATLEQRLLSTVAQETAIREQRISSVEQRLTMLEQPSPPPLAAVGRRIASRIRNLPLVRLFLKSQA